MRIDLHTHSSTSDGTDTAAEVVHKAAAAGLDVVALTDHDTAESWDEAVAAALATGITLVRGIEISTKHADLSVHLLAYLPDPTYAPLAEGLDRVLAGRNARVPAICARLADLGVGVTAEDVRRLSGDAAATGRPHVADAMIAAGAVRTREEAFAHYLNPGRPAYVHRYALPLTEAIGLVRAAGGVSVVAHPWGRHGASSLPVDVIAGLRDLGLAGLEVDHQDHDARAREQLRGIARELDLVVTGSSDYHGTGKVGHDLGCNTTAPGELERLLDLAAAAARESGRPTPEAVRP
ncbi:phosphatase [Nocardioides gansuensis]|uniref:Phosphatase n=1 Tax=Nocardioides gansuensis TaxID=2138300 RepID=A0A2T8FCS4_9ACTN|nr:PHP domain-containing protein [Nocardioides gansuensis]PVG83503.1 phosphatase [Nocardioides gansuensis]